MCVFPLLYAFSGFSASSSRFRRIGTSGPKRGVESAQFALYGAKITLYYGALETPHFPMLHLLKPASGSRSKRKRIARGNSGKGGTTAGRGTKGQHSRTGKGRKHGFEGGQVPLLRRQPKLGGFQSPRRKDYEVVNLWSLEEKLPAGTYSIEDLRQKRLVRKGTLVKILADGEISKKFSLEAHAASKKAKQALEKAGGTLTLIRD